jgi:threonine/homoserine/homoserine lactone efflux protein
VIESQATETLYIQSMNPTEWTALLVLATVSSFTPGPNTALSAALAANRGLLRSLHFVCAVPVGWGLLFCLCALGVGALVAAVPELKWAITLCGTTYLLWLARQLSRSRNLSQADTSRLGVSFLQGVMLQFMNIKAWMLALSITGGWISGQPDAASRTALLLPVMVGFGFFSNLTYALIGSLLRHWLCQGQRLLIFNRCMAATLVWTAAWIVWSTV